MGLIVSSLRAASTRARFTDESLTLGEREELTALHMTASLPVQSSGMLTVPANSLGPVKPKMDVGRAFLLYAFDAAMIDVERDTDIPYLRAKSDPSLCPKDAHRIIPTIQWPMEDEYLGGRMILCRSGCG